MSQFITANGVNTTLAAAITSTATSISLASTANLPTLETGQIIPLILRSTSAVGVFEIVYGTAISGSSITVERGMEGTSGQNFNVGDYVLCGPTAGTNALIPAVLNPDASETLPQAYEAAVQPSGLSEAITLTLPDAVPAGTSYLIFGEDSYAVTVDVSVTSGSPYIALPDGSKVYNWVIPAGTGQGLRVWFDGTNWRAQTFGQTVVAPAVANNQAPQAKQVASGALIAAPDTGAANAYAIALTPTPAALTPGMVVGIQSVGNTNTGAATLAVNGLSTLPILLGKGTALIGGELVAGYGALLRLNYAGTAWELIWTGAGEFVPPATQSNAAVQLIQLQNGSLNLDVLTGVFSNMQVFTSNGTFTVPDGVKNIRVICTGGGGGGSNCATTNGVTSDASGGGGGAGGTAIGIYPVTPGNQYTVTIGAGGASQAAGGASSFGSLCTGDGGGFSNFGATTSSSGGNGGNATGGIINIPGGGGSDGQDNSIVKSGNGGASFWGGGGRSGQGGGQNCSTYGGGGGGAYDSSNSGNVYSGGHGAPGIIIVQW